MHHQELLELSSFKHFLFIFFSEASLMKIPFISCVAVVFTCFSLPLLACVPDTHSAIKRLQPRLDALLSPMTESESDIVRSVTLLASPQQLATLCENPELRLAGHDNRLTGKRTVIANCGKRNHYLPVRMGANGSWWVARKELPGGHTIQIDDIERVTGDLDGQPRDLMFDANEIVGQRLTRALLPGKPLVQNQLRQQWRLRAGQTVDVVASTSGLSIRSQGKALNNAVISDTLKIRLNNGHIIQGKVNANGEVAVLLQQ
jgi:flagella basal body P-ring formation protein FlgA